MSVSTRVLNSSDAGNIAKVYRAIWEVAHDQGFELFLNTDAVGSGSTADPQFDGADPVLILKHDKLDSSHHDYYSRIKPMKTNYAYVTPEIYVGTDIDANNVALINEVQVFHWGSSSSSSSPKWSLMKIVADSRKGLMIYGVNGVDGIVLSIDRARDFEGTELDGLSFLGVNGANNIILYGIHAVSKFAVVSRHFTTSGLTEEAPVVSWAKSISNSSHFNVGLATQGYSYANGQKQIVMAPYPASPTLQLPHALWFIAAVGGGSYQVQVSENETGLFEANGFFTTDNDTKVLIRTS